MKRRVSSSPSIWTRSPDGEPARCSPTPFLEAEVEAYIEAANTERDEHGRALVVRNGHARSRKVVCGAGAIEVKAPRVNDKRG
jgi:putative transposase